MLQGMRRKNAAFMMFKVNEMLDPCLISIDLLRVQASPSPPQSADLSVGYPPPTHPPPPPLPPPFPTSAQGGPRRPKGRAAALRTSISSNAQDPHVCQQKCEIRKSKQCRPSSSLQITTSISKVTSQYLRNVNGRTRRWSGRGAAKER